MDAALGKLTPAIAVENIIFGEIENVNEILWHNPPCKQYIIMLHGSMEIEISDGARRIFHPGDVLLAEDTTGKGHITRAASEGVRKYLVIPVK